MSVMLAGLMPHRGILLLQNGAFQRVALEPSGQARKVIFNQVCSVVLVQMCSAGTEGKDGAWASDEFLVNFKHLKFQDLLREGDCFVFVPEMSSALGICLIQLMSFPLSVQLLKILWPICSVLRLWIFSGSCRLMVEVDLCRSLYWRSELSEDTHTPTNEDAWEEESVQS